MGLPPSLGLGSDELKQRVAPPVLAGDKIIALGITEAGGGSDVAKLKTTAIRDGDHYVVNGGKMFITSGMRADWLPCGGRSEEYTSELQSLMRNSYAVFCWTKKKYTWN